MNDKVTENQTNPPAAKKPSQRKAEPKPNGAEHKDQGDTSTMTEFSTIDGIEIEIAAIPTRGGKVKPEKYPFSKLPRSEKGASGAIEGPSFFISDEDQPEKHLTQARKQLHRSDGDSEFLFHARAAVKEIDGIEVAGKRVWKTVNPNYKV